MMSVSAFLIWLGFLSSSEIQLCLTRSESLVWLNPTHTHPNRYSLPFSSPHCELLLFLSTVHLSPEMKGVTLVHRSTGVLQAQNHLLKSEAGVLTMWVYLYLLSTEEARLELLKASGPPVKSHGILLAPICMLLPSCKYDIL